MQTFCEAGSVSSTCLYTAFAREGEEERGVLFPREQKRYAALPSKKKQDWLLGRIAAKRATAEFLRKNSELPVSEGMIEIVSDGAPYAVLHTASASSVVAAHLSISHSSGYAVAQVGDSSSVRGVGVDLERIRLFSPETLRDFLTEREHMLYESLPSSQQAEFSTRLWCLKEAYTKALGVGLLIHPRQVEIFQAKKGNISIAHNGQKTEAHAQWTKTPTFYILATITL